MTTRKLHLGKARFDTRLSKEQKAFFERAANEIILESEQILASPKDSEIFFDAITNSGKPNQKLSEAANEYKALFSK